MFFFVRSFVRFVSTTVLRAVWPTSLWEEGRKERALPFLSSSSPKLPELFFPPAFRDVFSPSLLCGPDFFLLLINDEAKGSGLGERSATAGCWKTLYKGDGCCCHRDDGLCPGGCRDEGARVKV